MNQRYRTVLFVLLAGVILAFTFYALRPREPVYQGRRLSAWLRDMGLYPAKYRHDAEEAVRQIGTNSLPTLLKLLAAKDSFLKKLTLASLAKMHPLIRVDWPSAQDLHVRAMLAFHVLGPEAKAAIPALTDLLKHPETAPSAARALMSIGPDAVLPLVRALTNENRIVRRTAAFGLGQIRSAETAVTLALVKSLKDADARVRHAAAESLRRTNEPDLVIPALLETLNDADSDVRREAMLSLAIFGSQAKEAVPALSQALYDTNSSVRLDAALALRQIDPQVVTVLAAKLEDTNSVVRSLTAEALRHFGQQASAAVPALLKALDDPDNDVRSKALVALREINPDEAVSFLMARLRDSDPEVRQKAAWMIRCFPQKALPALPLLSCLSSNDPDSKVRRAARRSLFFIQSSAKAKPAEK